jgi:hypothetical protein
MSLVPISIAWPSSLPVPHIDYTATAGVGTVNSDQDSLFIARRRRNSTTFPALSVKFVFTPVEYAQFRSFLRYDLFNSAAMFGIDLLWPKTSAVTSWICKFRRGMTTNFENGIWTVEAVLLLYQRVEIPDPDSGPVDDLEVVDDDDGDIVTGDDPTVTPPGSGGVIGEITSDYYWFLGSGTDPNTISSIIGEPALSTYKALFANEKLVHLPFVFGTITDWGNMYWYFHAESAPNKSAHHKVNFPSTDPTSTDGDVSVFASGGWVLSQFYRYTP